MEAPGSYFSQAVRSNLSAVGNRIGSGRRIGPRIRGDRQGSQIFRDLVGRRSRGHSRSAAATGGSRNAAATRGGSRTSRLAGIGLAARLAKQAIKQRYHRFADWGPRAAAGLLAAGVAARLGAS